MKEREIDRDPWGMRLEKQLDRAERRLVVWQRSAILAWTFVIGLVFARCGEGR